MARWIWFSIIFFWRLFGISGWDKMNFGAFSLCFPILKWHSTHLHHDSFQSFLKINPSDLDKSINKKTIDFSQINKHMVFCYLFCDTCWYLVAGRTNWAHLGEPGWATPWSWYTNTNGENPSKKCCGQALMRMNIISI